MNEKQLRDWSVHIIALLDRPGQGAIPEDQLSHPSIQFLLNQYAMSAVASSEEKHQLCQLLEAIRQDAGEAWFRNIQGDESSTPLDDAYFILCAIGAIGRHENQALLRHEARRSFAADAREQAEELMVSDVADSPEGQDDAVVLTIDDPWATDLDDAFSIANVDGKIQLGIHISNVASCVPLGSPLDLEARERGSTIYTPDEIVHMLPQDLAEYQLSLQPNVPRRCLSLYGQVEDDFTVTGWRLVDDVIESTNRCTYDQVQEVLDGKASAEGALASVFELLRSIAKRAEEIRLGGEKPRPITPDYRVHYERVTDQLTVEPLPMDHDSRRLVAELMVLYNSQLATFAAEEEVPLLYRTQQELEEEESSENAEESSSEENAGGAVYQRFAPSQWSVTPGRHAALHLDAYARGSSPIRSYVDYLNQAQILGHLSGNSTLEGEQLEAMLEEIIAAQKKVRIIQKESLRYWWQEYLKRSFQSELGESEATVLKADGERTLYVVAGTALVVAGAPTSLRKGDFARVSFDALHPRTNYVVVQEVAS